MEGWTWFLISILLNDCKGRAAGVALKVHTCSVYFFASKPWETCLCSALGAPAAALGSQATDLGCLCFSQRQQGDFLPPRPFIPQNSRTGSSQRPSLDVHHPCSPSWDTCAPPGSTGCSSQIWVGPWFSCQICVGPWFSCLRRRTYRLQKISSSDIFGRPCDDFSQPLITPALEGCPED